MEMVQGEGISVGGKKLVGARPSTHLRSEKPGVQKSITLGPLRLPAWSASVYVSIAVLLVLLSAGFAVAAIQEALPFLGLLAFNALAGSGLSAYLARRVAGSSPTTPAPSPIEIERRTRLLQHLNSVAEPQTVEELQQSLGWTEEALIPTLEFLVTAQRLDEDLDLESGHWAYALPAPQVVLDTEVSSEVPAKALPITERAEAIRTRQ
ncbi:hypothetical protein DL240_04650 [Lujinxingia litoralis]|uniref:Uncharacterized protein n=2 Tax=Lujinxingia litoralis TaxID=2211119 RepID=A0A328CES8_9DELT|nr:hypothetical protein DL240_04650 [Lujinxingia litoralis]